MATHIRAKRSIDAPIESLYEAARELSTDPAHWLLGAKQFQTLGMPESEAFDAATHFFFVSHHKQRLAEAPDPEPRAL